MSRIKTFIQFQDRQAEDVTEILDQVGISVSVYRSSGNTSNAGFQAEIASPSFLKNILVYLNPVRNNVFSGRVTSDAGKGSEIAYIGITSDTDVRIDDIWKLKGEEYVVESVDNASTGKTEARIVKKV